MWSGGGCSCPMAPNFGNGPHLRNLKAFKNIQDDASGQSFAGKYCPRYAVPNPKVLSRCVRMSLTYSCGMLVCVLWVYLL